VNNGIFVQDSYDSKVSFESQSIKGLFGNPTLVPLPYSCSFNRWDPNKLVYVIDTRLQSSTTITFMTSNLTYTIDWGDGYVQSVSVTSAYASIPHAYASHGVYIIQTDNVNNPIIGGASLIAILSFGTFPSNGSLIYSAGGGGSFASSSNLLFVPSNLPAHNSLDLGLAFNNAFRLNDRNISLWDTSKVTTMRYLFQNNRVFNQPLNSWDTSNVTSMQGMFAGALSFNQDLNNWNVRKVTLFDSMFAGATNFNGSLIGWEVGADTAGTSCAYMFNNCRNFNQDLNSWNVSKVTNFAHMFNGASSFNQSLSSWNTISATSTGMDSMFVNAVAFNGDVGNFNTTNVTSFGNMFNTATSFNKPISNWNVSNVTITANMFLNATSFNQSLDNWNVRKCTNMNGMFYGTNSFNSSLNNWSPGLDSTGVDCGQMFRNARSFNQNLTSWNVSKVTNMSNMFLCDGIPGGNVPSAFQGDISNWNLAGLNASTSLDNFMSGKNLTDRYSTANYDALLIGWNNNKLAAANGVANWRTDLRPHFGGARYTSGGAAATARAALVSYGWTITDGGVA